MDVDWPRIMARKNAIVSSIVANLERSLHENPRITLLRGNARFAGPTRLDVDGQQVEAEKIIVASGVMPVIPDIPGLREAGFETNETVMDMKSLPRSMVVIGGGQEGMEYAQMFHRFGVRITLLQRRERVLPREDEEISRERRSPASWRTSCARRAWTSERARFPSASNGSPAAGSL